MWKLKHAWKKSAGSLFQIRTGNGYTEKDKRQKNPDMRKAGLL